MVRPSPLFFPACRKGTSIPRGRRVNHSAGRTGEFGGGAGRRMGKVTIALIVIVVLAVIAGGVFLANWNPPPPSTPVEKVLPDARFPK
jgi:hypothetical protein